MTFFPLMLQWWIILVSGPVVPEANQNIRTIEIRAISGLQYDQVRFSVLPGETVRIKLINTDEMSHNLVITLPGRRMAVVEQAAGLGDEGPVRSFIPTSQDVLAAIPVLDPDEISDILFVAPSAEGIYPYVCTYPGHGQVMYGAMYVTKNQMPPLSTDQNIPEQRREQGMASTDHHSAEHPWNPVFPTFYRTFLPETGPASIAVGLPGQISYCWDTDQCRLRYAWKGGFVNMERAWSGKGKERADLVGVVFYRDSVRRPIQISSSTTNPKVEYLGYRIVNRFPVFMYRVDGVEVTECNSVDPSGTGLQRHFELDGIHEPVTLHFTPHDQLKFSSDKGAWKNSVLHLNTDEAESFTVYITEKAE